MDHVTTRVVYNVMCNQNTVYSVSLKYLTFVPGNHTIPGGIVCHMHVTLYHIHKVCPCIHCFTDEHIYIIYVTWKNTVMVGPDKPAIPG